MVYRNNAPAQTTFSVPGSRYCSSSGAVPTWRVLSFNNQRRAFERWYSVRLQGPEGFFKSSRAASTRPSLQGPAGFFFASRAYSSRAASTRRKFSASLHGTAGFFFASSLDTAHVQSKPSRTSGLLLHEQLRHNAISSHGATTRGLMRWRIEEKTDAFFSRTLCETRVAESLRPANIRYLQVRQKFGGACYMCAV